MKLSSGLALWLVSAVARVASASLLDELPKCALKCFAATLPTTSCASTDIACLCSDASFMGAAAACNSMNCTVIEVLAATNATYAACGIPVRDDSATLIGVCSSFGALALLMVIMRLIDRGISATARLGWDDIFIGLSALGCIGMNGPAIVAAAYGFGKDIWAFTPEDLTTSLHWLWFAYPFYMWTEAFCQASILAFYLRIMTNPTNRNVVWGCLILVAGFGIANIFVMIFQCWPIRYFWEGWKGEMIPDSHIDMNLFSYIRGGLEIGLDLLILILPLPMLVKLQISSKKKLQILSMFCVGFVITGVSIARLHALVHFATTTNPTYDNTEQLYWCSLEANLFIIVACMPAVHALFHKAVSRALGRKTNTGSGSGNLNQYYKGRSSQKSGGSLPFGKISIKTDVEVYRSACRDRSDHRSDRSESDLELVERGA